ncbi:MAG: 16S rRNA (adenine(1518)-N(6)/adenine(1519)-N(6))-dimethyltransferase RsmA [Sandaracinaceae bacterium]|nr:16S rRNA (adenine(1518)-N(6)/adenine(1519)-N(6))-dimethyltransferase RsmA [Sandaracinaceae bacterium]
MSREPSVGGLPSANEVPHWEDPRRALARHGARPKRSFSQNFLVARPIVEAIADAVGIAPGDPVLELGPGLGTLSAALVRRGARVLAVEKDREMIGVLEDDLVSPCSPLREGAPLPNGAAFEVEEGDATSVDLTALRARWGRRDGHEPSPLVVVGNLPYAVTGAIFKNLVAHRADVARAIVMIQKEVRDRLLAEPGTKDYGTLTVFVRASYRVESVLKAPAGAFHPPPRVESAVVRLVPRADPIEETDAFRRAVRACFEQRRKTLRNGLVAIVGAARADEVLSRAGIDGRRRGETLSLVEIAALASALA